MWSRTAELCNILKEMDTSHVKLLAERKECKYREHDSRHGHFFYKSCVFL